MFHADRCRYYCDACGRDVTTQQSSVSGVDLHFCDEACAEHYRVAPPLGAAAALCKISQFKGAVPDVMLMSEEALANIVALCEEDSNGTT